MKLLLETVTYIAIKERITCIITMETLICIMHCRKYHLRNCKTPIYIITIKIVTRVFAAETVTCTGAVKTSSCIITTETVTCIIVTERSTNIQITERTTLKPEKWNQCCHLRNCHGKCQLHSSNRNCHLQNWLHKFSLAEMVPVWDSLSYNREIKQMSMH